MLRGAIVALVLGLTAQLCVVGALFAATTPSPDIDVQVWAGAQAGQAIVIVGTTLPDDTALPTTVRLPIVNGTTVDWAGEIGGASGQDMQREFTIEQGSGGQYAEFELEGSRQAQIELSGIPLTVTGNKYSANVDWVQTVPANVTLFSVRLPAGISNVTLNPPPAREPDTNQAGESLYTLPSKELPEGGAQLVSLAYTIGEATPTTPVATDYNVVVGVLLLLLVALIVVLVLVMARQRRQAP
jgi:hypothetical protein